MSGSNEVQIIRALANQWATYYQTKHNRGPSVATGLTTNSQMGLEFFLKDAFARAGGEQAGYGQICLQALRHWVSQSGSYANLIIRTDAPSVVWNRFQEICQNKGIGSNGMINQTVVKGLVELAQKSYTHNPFVQLGQMLGTSTLDAYLALRNIKGIGDKVASFLLRDVVTILDAESKLASQDLVLCQPIDRWVRGIASVIWPELNQRAPDWFIAMRIVSDCLRCGASPSKFNQGAWQFGTSMIVTTNTIPSNIENLLTAVASAEFELS